MKPVMHETATMHHYSAYGLTLASDIVLPAIPEIEARDPDVTIVAGSLDPEAFSGEPMRNRRAEPGRLLLQLPGGAHILVEQGARITYQHLQQGDDRHLLSEIMGTGLEATLLQRGLLLLRASCVHTEYGAVLVIGKPGAGKSTMLAGMITLGHTMMADDITAVTLDAEQRPLALPAYPTLNLWQDALELAGQETAGLARIHPKAAKYYVPVERFHAMPELIIGIIWLVPGDTTDSLLDPLDPAERCEPLGEMICCKNLLSTFGLEPFALRHVAALAEHVPMVKYERPSISFAPEILAKHALAAIGV